MLIAVDTETTGLNFWLGAKPFAIGICLFETEFLYVDFPVNPKTREPDYSKPSDAAVFRKIRVLLESDQVDKVFHNAKFDIRMLNASGLNIKVQGKIHDTILASRVCNTLEDSVKLKVLAKKYVDIDTSDEDALYNLTRSLNLKAAKLGFNIGEAIEANYWIVKTLIPTDKLCETYCKRDTLRAFLLWQFYEEGLKQLGLRHVYDKEIELSHLITEMENHGIAINEAKVNETIKTLTTEINNLEQEIYRTHGTLNINSSTQLGKLLFETLKLPILKYTESGKPSTDQQVLKKLSNEHNSELAGKLLKHSGLSTGLGYYKNYKKHSRNGIINTTLKQFDTKTWRLSCVEPNLQNVTKPETSGGECSIDGRCVFGPRKGYFWWMIDYAQLELRIFADRAKEQKLLDAFNCGRDPHDETRLSVPFLAAMPKEKGRKIAKNTNFCIINRGGANVLNVKYGVPLPEGRIIINQFYEAYPDTKLRQEYLHKFALETGYIINAYNRKLYIDRERAYTTAPSYDIQSSAADLIKRAMLKLDRLFKGNSLDIALTLQIHDELVIEVHNSYLSQEQVILKQIKKIMENSDGAFSIETPVDIKRTFTHWSEYEKIEVK